MLLENVLQAIGNTPIVRLNRIAENCSAELYAKLEFMNPGGSIKDRLGYWLIEDAEKKRTLKPGGTIIEGTSGNTGVGLAITSAIKGYQCVFVLPDKMSEEKIKNLRAFGAKVVVTPTAVAPEDPRSYYSVSRRLATETPNSIYIDQYNNLANRECHYNTTGPEILKQMPDIDVFIAGIGTGGTICGVGRYLKEKRPSVEVVAVDPKGSIVLDKFHGRDVPAESYVLEGIGEDFIPKNYDFEVIDDMVRVEDKECFVKTRELLKKEGIYAGVSSGAVIVGAERWIREQGDRLKGKKVLLILPDSGNRYLSKVYDDDWMREMGFLDKPSLGSVSDLLHFLHVQPGSILTARPNAKLSAVIEEMKIKGISQMPVVDAEGWIKGVISEEIILSALYEERARPGDPVETLADASIAILKLEDPIEKASNLVTDGKVPVVINDKKPNDILGIITKIDLLTYLGNRHS